MTRTLMPAAASLALALCGLPAVAAEIGDEDQVLAPVTSDDLAAPAAAPVDGEEAARKGKAAARGNKARARTAGQRGAIRQGAARQGAVQQGAVQRGVVQQGALPAASSRAAAAQPGRLATPARAEASRSASSAARSQGSNAQRPGGNRPVAHNVHARPGRGTAVARPGSRPSAARRHAPRRYIVHHRAGLPVRWAPGWHRYHLRGVPRYSPRYWAAGIFIYSPPPRAHRVVVVDGAGRRVKDAPAPSRAVDRNNSFSVGLRGGSYISGYNDGASYGDLGLGLSLSYRPVEAIGLDLTWMHHSDSWDETAERTQDPISASVELFAFPWTRVSPYAFVGLTSTPRAADDTYFHGTEEVHYQANDALFGPHAGLGIEFAVGQSASLSFDGRYIGYVDVHDGDTAVPGAVQGQMGLNFYF